MRLVTQLLCFLIVLTVTQATAQGKFTISGTVKDAGTGESMIGVNVYVLELKGIGTGSNEYGFYSLTLPQASYHIVYTMVGYVSDTVAINLLADTKVDRSLSEMASQLGEIVVTATRTDANVTDVQVGVEKLEVREIAKIPVLFGERDISKAFDRGTPVAMIIGSCLMLSDC